MKRHKIWYKRELFKKHFKSYKDWDNFNPPSGDKHPARYKTDILQCKNPDCPREGMSISEHEAFYHFARLSRLKRLKMRIIVFLVKRKQKVNKGIYICPFCKEGDVSEV